MAISNISLGRYVLAMAGLLVLGSTLYAGHCGGDCCNPCPPYHSEFFGYYPTQWRPWPGAKAIPTQAAHRSLPAGAVAGPIVPAAAVYQVPKVPEQPAPAPRPLPVVTALPPEANISATDKPMFFRSENGTPITVQFAPVKSANPKTDTGESWHNPVPPPLEKPYVP